MGESFGVYTLGADPFLMPLVTSVNIACGFHAGDPQVMKRTVRLAIQHHVAIGAHPGYPDLVGFGRRALDATPSEIENDVLYQIGASSAFVRAAGGALTHVKAHGELYRLAALELKIAQAIARAIVHFDSNLTIIGLPDRRWWTQRDKLDYAVHVKDMWIAPTCSMGRSSRAASPVR